MTREEMIDLVEFIAIVCPQQKINRASAVAWYEVIGDLDFEAARNAVIAVKHSQPFVDPSDIIREAHRRETSRPYERTAAEAIAESSLRELPAALAAPPNEEYQRAKRDLLVKMAARDSAVMGDKPPHPPVSEAARRAAYAVACPWCHAQPLSPCVNATLGTPKTEPHPARLAEARAEARTPA